MSKTASEQYLFDNLIKSMQFSVDYMRAMRLGETNEAERIEHEWSEWLEQLSKEAES